MAVQGGFGCVIQVDVSATPTTIPNVVDATPPKLEPVMADITAHDSAAGMNEFIPSGRVNTSELTFTIVFDESATTHAELRTLAGSKAVATYVFKDSATTETLTFEGYVAGFQRVSAQDDAYKVEVTIRPTGEIVLS
jgi:hypothetical protein